MLDFFYWFSQIIIAIILAYVAFKYMKKIRNLKIDQTAESMKGVRGAEFKLSDGEDLHIQDAEITQTSKQMENVIGVSFEATGKQSARLQGVTIRRPGAELKISADPNVKVEINKQK